MKTRVTPVAVENLVGMFIVLWRETYFAVCLKEGFELLYPGTLFPQGLFDSHFLDGHDLQRVIEQLFCLIIVPFLEQ